MVRKVLGIIASIILAILFLSSFSNPVKADTISYGLGTDGVSTYFSNSSVIPNIAGDASFDFWFYWKNDGNYGTRKAFFTTGSPTNDSPSYLFYVDPDGHMGMYDNAGHDCSENLAHSWAQNTWYHIYWGRDASTGTCYFGVNGDVTTAVSTAGNYSGQFTGLWWGTGYYGKVNGTFDEIRVSSNVRWTTNFSLPTSEYVTDSDTLALWHMNEGAGVTSADDSGNGYSLELNGATWDPGYFNSTPPPTPTPLPTPVPGIYGLGTNGTTSYFYNTEVVPNTAGDASFDFWLYWKNPGNYDSRRGIFTTASPTNDSPSYLFYVEPNGSLGMYDNANHPCTESVTRNWLQDTWYHVYWGRNATTGSCYFGVNGTVTTSPSSPGNYNGQATGLWWGTGYYGKVNGTFDEIRVSDIVRWTDNFSLPTSAYSTDANTVALWHMDEGSGTMSIDNSGNSYTLALSGATWDPGYFGPASTPTPTLTPTPAIPQLTALLPAQIWVGLKNSDSVGIKFDLLAEVFKDGSLLSSGQIDSVPGGSSGFNNAKLNSIPFSGFSPVEVPSGTELSVKLSVRNACVGSGHNSGTARLWFNDSGASSKFGATIGDNTDNYYLIDQFALWTYPGVGPKKTIDVAAGAKCSPFKPFGTWLTTL
jgi:hypothetical protein